MKARDLKMDLPKMKIFYSWQSDLPNSTNRNLIQSSIDKTVKVFNNIIKIEADRDTKNQLGSPDITESIFEKIDECDLFIADITIINKSKCNILRDKKRATPNPNVLIELGYAVKTVGWERIICIYNSDYSSLEALPFDLRQHRITSYSIKKEGKSKAKNNLMEVLSGTIKKLAEEGNVIRPKNNKAHHKIISYNFNENKFEDKICIYHPQDYCDIKNLLIDECERLVQDIRNIKFNYTPKDLDEEIQIEEKMSIPQLLGNYTLVKINEKTKKEIFDKVKFLFGIELDDEFFFAGNLKRKHDILRGYDYSGGDLEKEKNDLFIDLENTLLKIEIFDEYIKTFDNISFIPLAITNVSSELDNDINIGIVVEGEDFELLEPTKELITENLIGSEGTICEFEFIPTLFDLPEDFNVKYDNIIEVPNLDIKPKIGIFDNSPDYDEDDYENELKSYIATPISKNSYIFKIGTLQPQETKWFGGILMLKIKKGNVKIKYTIRSNNSDGNLGGILN